MFPMQIIQLLLSGMWQGYRRWMSLFNVLSIVLSVTLATVILGFAEGVRAYVHEMVEKEAAAGAVRVHLGGWQPEGQRLSFRERIGDADDFIRNSNLARRYDGFNLWWRSEAHSLSLGHPADKSTRGIFSKIGNTYPEDPEAARVRSYAVGGRWVSSEDAPEIVLSAEVALKLSRQLPGSSSLNDLVDREIWIMLPGTRTHMPAACAKVLVVGIFENLRDQASLATPHVIQDMFTRVRSNANGEWHETYDRLEYTVQSLANNDHPPVSTAGSGAYVPLVCWRINDHETPWIHTRGAIRCNPPPEVSEDGVRHTNAGCISNQGTIVAEVIPVGIKEGFTSRAPALEELPASPILDVSALDEAYPNGYVLCSPRVWNDLGYEAAPRFDVGPWQDEALYAYLHFRDLKSAVRARALLGSRGFNTYMPIDRFKGLVTLVRLITIGAVLLLISVLFAGLLGIAVTLYNEVEAEEGEIGLLKALGASNRLIAWVFLVKGGVIGALGVCAGVPLAVYAGGRINQVISQAVAGTVGIQRVEQGFYHTAPGIIFLICSGVILLAGAAALLPALQAAGKDPQEALRAE
jgi:hypothetical protein